MEGSKKITAQRDSKWSIVLGASVIAAAALAAYGNSVGGVFVYDDQLAIVENTTIRQLWPIWPVLVPPHKGETVSGRPLLNLTLAINYAMSGLNVWSYHVVNLLIHVGAALLLFGILRRTFLMPVLQDRFGRAATPLALASALVWTVHPLQTDSVTYIIQRAESLMGFFYLLTLYCVIRGATASRHVTPETIKQAPLSRQRSKIRRERVWVTWWNCAAILACVLGMATKEVMVTAPLIVLLYDRTFLAGSFIAALRRRWPLYLGLAATWALLAYLVLSTGLIGHQTELGAPSVWHYARSQPGVILHYLRLSVWPHPLCLDYDWPVADSLGNILPAAVVVGVLFAGSVWGFVARRPCGFLGAWFLVILAPTSSVLPLRQLAFEHRMYLSLASVVVVVVAASYIFYERWRSQRRRSQIGAFALRWSMVVGVTAAVMGLGYATNVRNRDFRSSLAIWQDVVTKSPHNAYAHNNLANVLVSAGRYAEAIEHCLISLRLEAANPLAHYNLGIALLRTAKTEEAIDQFQHALRISPDYAQAHYNLACALHVLGKAHEAIEHYQRALELRPEMAEAYINLAAILADRGRTDEAIQRLRQSLRLHPNSALAHNNLAIALNTKGKSSEAIEEYRKALQLDPAYAEAHYNLGLVLNALGNTAEAIEHWKEAVRLQPHLVKARRHLAAALDTLSRPHEASEQSGAIHRANGVGQEHPLSPGTPPR